jgi:hypothetical protein
MYIYYYNTQINMPSQKCVLCNKQSNKQQGGSLASDSVIQLVDCDTFDRMSSVATNHVGGSDIGRFKLVNAVTNGGARKQRGGAACASLEVPQSTLAEYTLRSGNIPTNIANANNASLNYAGVNGSVLKALQAEVATHQDVFNKVAFPASLKSLNLMQAGGKCKSKPSK